MSLIPDVQLKTTEEIIKVLTRENDNFTTVYPDDQFKISLAFSGALLVVLVKQCNIIDDFLNLSQGRTFNKILKEFKASDFAQELNLSKGL